MKYIITLLALSLLAGGTLNLNAQTNNIPAEIAAITAKDQISLDEALAVQSYYTTNAPTPAEGWQAWVAAARTIEAKSPYAAASVRLGEWSSAGWTAEMVKESFGAAAMVAAHPNATDEFRKLVWDNMPPVATTGGPAGIGFFKKFRASLPKDQQLLATQQQKDGLLALPIRSERDNAWLAEVSADLVALQLDQQQ